MTEIINRELQMTDSKKQSLWKWFHPVNWMTGFIAFAISLATYIYTLQPTVGLEDSGELITGAYKLGVPHPPGYPVWSILAKILTFIPVGDVAYRVNLLSALCGALSAGMLALILSKTGDLFFSKDEQELSSHHLLPAFEKFGLTTPRLVNSLCAVAAGVLFAYTPGTWSQSTIAEVYALNCFYMTLIVTLSLVFMFNPNRRFLFYAISFFFAQAITNHQTIAVMIFSLGWLAWCTRKNNEDFIVLFINAIVLLIFTKFIFNRYHMLSFEGGKFLFGFVGPFIMYLVAVYFINKRLFNDTEWVKLAGSFFLGLSVCIYLPIASITNPQLNWGRPRTVEGFWHSILRGQYEKPHFLNRDGNNIVNSKDFNHFFKQCWLYLKDTWDQYPLVLIFAFLSIVALVVLWKKIKIRNWLLYSIITFVLCGIGMVFTMNPKLDVTSQYINRVFFIMSHAGLGLLVGYGMLTVVALLFSISKNRNTMWRNIVIAIGLIFVVFGLFFTAVPVFKDSVNFPHWILSANSSGPVLLGIIFGLLFVFIGIFILLGISMPKSSYIASILIALCILITPFIPATKHWDEMNLRKKYFGYIYGIEMLKNCDPGAIFYGGTDPGRFVPLYMINCDKFRSDVWLITQNGLADATYMNVLRDRFCKPRQVWGWARGLLKALDAEREDHKGENTIYIPSRQDFERSFQIYIKNVQERKKRGEHIEEEVTIKDGKISVGGVAGVMRLNGILTKMIWEENKDKHSFYVEESYVIPWMYPYLEPAGMIMKLNAEKVKITPEIVKKDFDYWNNITNMFANGGVIEFSDLSPSITNDNPEIVKLFCNNKPDGRPGRIIIKPNEFKDDVTAQKSFSKCRSANAGLYEYHRMWTEAENAYKQAIWFYPVSAEAYMRLANMYMKIGQYGKALTAVEEYKRKDPLNMRVDGMLDAIRSQKNMSDRFGKLQKKILTGKDVNVDDYIKYLQILNQRGQKAEAQRLYDLLLSDNSPVTNGKIYQFLGTIFSQQNDFGRLKKLFDKMIAANPDDWNVWLNYSTYYFAIGNIDEGFKCIEKALKINTPQVTGRLWQDDRFKPIRESADPVMKKRFMDLTR